MWFKRRPGRRPIDPIRRRWCVIKVRVNASEWLQFAGLAQRCRTSLSSVLRLAVVNALPRVIPPSNLTAFGSLARLNSNLTQLVDAIAGARAPEVSSPDLYELNDLLAEVRHLLLGLNVTDRKRNR